MTDTPISLISRFETAARRGFEARLERVRREYGRYLTSVPAGGARFDVRELAAELMTMPEMERYVLLRRIVPDTSGPATLEGLEALRSFLGNYMLDDGECVVVPEPDPANLDEDAYFTATLDFIRFDEDNAGLDEAAMRAKALVAFAERERPLVVVRIRSDAERAAGPADVLAAIRSNRAMEVRRAAEAAEFLDDADEPSSFTP